jgi:hypothetical protein
MPHLLSRRVVLHRVLAPVLVGGALLFAAGSGRQAGALERGPAEAAAATQSVDPPASPSLAQVSWLDIDSGNVAVEFLGTAVSSNAYMMGPLTDDTSAHLSAEALGPVALTPVAAPRFQPRPQASRTHHAAGFWEGVPTRTVLLIPVALGLALLVAWALGPSGRPQPVRKRAGGLSRALDRRRGGGDAN